MEPIKPEEIKNASDISAETKKEFIDKVIATFKEYYILDDVEQHIEVMRSFGDDSKAVIQHVYVALIESEQDPVKFIEATGLLATGLDTE